MNKRALLIAIGLVVVTVGWYAFRPERLFINEVVDEAFPGTTSQTTTKMAEPLSYGMFHSVAHETRGTATIYKLDNGKRVLRFTDFETSNGPDVNVYLVAARDANDNETVTKAGFVTLGAIKGNKGDQNYDVPGDVDLNEYRAVTVWCRRFGVNFATAALQVKDAQPVVLSKGNFHSVAHDTKGTAAIYELPDGRRILRFTDFETSNGPDVQVYLGYANDANDNETVKKAGFYHLAALKGNKGDQNYEIPGDVDLGKVKSVTVWCRRFAVNFGTAPLSDGTTTDKMSAM
jgi:hypothetical protein